MYQWISSRDHEAKWMTCNGHSDARRWAPFVLIGDKVTFDFGKQNQVSLQNQTKWLTCEETGSFCSRVLIEMNSGAWSSLPRILAFCTRHVYIWGLYTLHYCKTGLILSLAMPGGSLCGIKLVMYEDDRKIQKFTLRIPNTRVYVENGRHRTSFLMMVRGLICLVTGPKWFLICTHN